MFVREYLHIYLLREYLPDQKVYLPRYWRPCGDSPGDRGAARGRGSPGSPGSPGQPPPGPRSPQPPAWPLPGEGVAAGGGGRGRGRHQPGLRRSGGHSCQPPPRHQPRGAGLGLAASAQPRAGARLHQRLSSPSSLPQHHHGAGGGQGQAVPGAQETQEAEEEEEEERQTVSEESHES